MFERFSEAAERLAAHVSRRDFFGCVGKSALALAGVLGGMVAFPTDTKAGGNGNLCCVYGILGPITSCKKAKQGSCSNGGVLVVCKQFPQICPG
jgi:hypothetical protein